MLKESAFVWFPSCKQDKWWFAYSVMYEEQYELYNSIYLVLISLQDGQFKIDKKCKKKTSPEEFDAQDMYASTQSCN